MTRVGTRNDGASTIDALDDRGDLIVPRPERPLEGRDDQLVEFAAALGRLRAQAGSPAYRVLSRRAHYSAAALSDAAGGRKLPSLAVALACVAACGGDTTAWERRWRATAKAR